MNKSVPILLLAFGLLGMNSPAIEPDNQSQKVEVEPSIEGVWQITRLTAPREEDPGFEEAPPGVAENLKLSFKDGEMTFIPGEPGFTCYTYTIDPEKDPKQMDWKPVEKSNKDDGAAHLIYGIEGDKITIMFNPETPDKRPVGFDRKACYVYEGKRVLALAPAADAQSSRKTNPALLYWQAAAELPSLSDTQVKQLREIADGKVDFKAEILEGSDFKWTLAFLRKAVASEAPCEWGLAWEDTLEMRTPHLAKMREFSVVTLVLAEAKFANGETASGIDLLLIAHHIARDAGADSSILGNVIQNFLERRTIAAEARHCLRWDTAGRADYSRRLAALPELSPLHRAFLTELVWIDWFKNEIEGNLEEASKKFGLSGKYSDLLKSPGVIEEMIEIYRKKHAEGIVILKLEGEARHLAVAEFEKEQVANKDLPKNLFVSLLMPKLSNMVRSEDQTILAKAMMKSALEHGPEIGEQDVDGQPFELIRKDDGIELNSEALKFTLEFRK